VSSPFSLIWSYVAQFLFSSRASSVISTITLSHLPGYLRGGLASISPCVRYPPVNSGFRLLHRRLLGVTPLYSPTCNFDVLCNPKSISIVPVNTVVCIENIIPYILFILRISLHHLPFLTPSRSNSILIRRLTKISPFRTYRCTRRSHMPSDSASPTNEDS
jgi:hypothetical protein